MLSIFPQWNSHLFLSESSFPGENVAEICWIRQFRASKIAKFSLLPNGSSHREVGKSYLITCASLCPLPLFKNWFNGSKMAVIKIVNNIPDLSDQDIQIIVIKK